MLLLERQQIPDLVVAVRDVDARVLEEHVVADELELARIRVHELDAALRAVILDEVRLLFGTFGDILRLDEWQAAAAPPQGPRVVEQHLQEQIALVARRLDGEQRVVARERRPYV